MEPLPRVAMVTRAQARVGLVFRVMPNARCLTCRLYKVCAGLLRPKGRYKILAVRRKAHFCPLIRDYMVVVEVEELPLLAAVESKVAVEGVTLRYESISCPRDSCPYYEYCTNSPLVEGEKVKVVKVVERIACPASRSLMLVELLPVASFKDPNSR
ncbi:MAG: hypothetical protein DRJ96_00910 [Thermoprotei archaeon]|nr:UPF0179 family protein [Thermoproteales archaeon]RLE88992.1 MAG: hypothetical protein DRJ67_00475 [Thermoprotei archaeon]RLE98504.1 MAG: hypothetical protein DRJ96_00910 [Thermoprotei archaeon]